MNISLVLMKLKQCKESNVSSIFFNMSQLTINFKRARNLKRKNELKKAVILPASSANVRATFSIYI